MVVVAVIFALGKNTPVFPWLYEHVPTFSMFNAPARWMVWAVFFLTLLAGVGINEWHRPTGKALRRFKRLTAASAAVTLGAVAAWISLQNIQITFIQATASLGIWATGVCLITLIMPWDGSGPFYKRWVWLAVIWTALDMVWAGWGGQPLVPTAYFNAPGGQSAGAINERVYLNDQDEYAIKFHRFFRFADYNAIEDWQNLKDLSLPDMNLTASKPFAYVNNFDPFVPERFAKWMAFVNSLSANQREKIFPLMGVNRSIVREVSQTEGYRSILFEGAHRIQWKSCPQWVATGQAAFEQVTTWMDTHADWSDASILEGTGMHADCGRAQNGEVTILVDTPNRLVLNTRAVQDGYIYVADTWYPGWKAVVDGQNVEILHANYAFRAVKVVAGAHTVSFEYAPQSFYIGVGLSIAAILFMVLWCLLIKVRVK
jgi:hypothetical protein